MATAVARRKTTTEKGLGHRHRQQVEQLFSALPPVGDPRNPCDVCRRPRHKDRTKNYDYNPNSSNPANGVLQGDHSKMSRAEAIRRGLPIQLPDRLLHGECNRLRGEGLNDHIFSGANPPETTTQLLMPWPW